MGQPRAVEAVRFGVRMAREGFNIYALGPSGTGKHTLVRRALEEQAGRRSPPPDWCYVYDFSAPHRPRALRLPAGTGVRLREAMRQLVADVRSALPAAFESDEYQTRREVIQQEFVERQQKAFETLHQKAQERGLALLHTPAGFAFAPVRQGQVLPPEEFRRLPPEEQERITADIQAMQEELQRALRQMPRWQRELRQKLMELDREVAGYTVRPLVEEVRRHYQHLPEVMAYLDEVEADIIANAALFLRSEAQQAAPPAVADAQQHALGTPLRRYEVNVLVDHGQARGAPVVYEDNPTFANLLGRVEHVTHMGTLVTDFTLIKPGALHRANGGYLILDAHRLLQHPLAWDGLKRALRSRQLRIESPAQTLGLVSTVSLDPEPIPLDVKVVLLGDRRLYYMLSLLDPDFPELFKVAADFDDRMGRAPDDERLYARLLATLVQREELRPFRADAVARVIEESSRWTGDAARLSTRMNRVVDLLREADYWAGQAGAGMVEAEHVAQAVEAHVFRADRVRQRVQEEILRGILRVETAGERVGQVNGLSVIDLGNFAFGRPTRITARVWAGRGAVVDIEREVRLAGPIHSKGVLILSAFLEGRYAAERPLSLSASLVFEQSYGEVEGDSASVAELIALLSAIADVPVKQSLAVTGSVDQHGNVQAVGRVNEKIEGFFDICRARGLTGDQGVVIPRANVGHLMVREDVVQAVAEGHFAIYAVETVDEAIELLMGIEAGERDEEGAYPEGSLNALVVQRLEQLEREAKRRRGGGPDGEEGEEDGDPSHGEATDTSGEGKQEPDEEEGEETP